MYLFTNQLNIMILMKLEILFLMKIFLIRFKEVCLLLYHQKKKVIRKSIRLFLYLKIRVYIYNNMIFNFVNNTYEIVEQLINNLNSIDGPVSSEIPSLVIKVSNNSLESILTELFNQSFVIGKLPTE